ncbi:MAG: DUF3558 family protein [Acidimicrobiia bacterium]
MSRILNLLVVLLLVTVAACSSDTGDAASTTQPGDVTAPSAEEADSSGTTAPRESTVPETTSGTATSSLDIDPCSLLTSEEISAATGVEFGEGTINQTMTNDGQAVCDWLSSGSEFATAQVLTVNGDVFDSNMSSAEEVFGLAAEPVDVPGSDRTYATAEGSIVAMQIGNTFVQVAYLPPGPGEVLDSTLQLAKLAAGRMP